ncbi:MAG: chemotaxis protein chel [Rubritepida sp.]|nr:chemotaxis protein chel [Rubritepida sp.]
MLAPVNRNTSAPTPERMRQVAQNFESQVLAQLMQPAFDTVDTSKSSFGGGKAEEQWRPMMVEAFAAGAVRAGRGIGIQDMVLRHMIRMQDIANQPQETRP